MNDWKSLELTKGLTIGYSEKSEKFSFTTQKGCIGEITIIIGKEGLNTYLGFAEEKSEEE